MRMMSEKTTNERNGRNGKQNPIMANALEAAEADTTEQEDSSKKRAKDEDIPPITHVVDNTTVNTFGRIAHRIGATNGTLTAVDAEEAGQVVDRAHQVMAIMVTQLAKVTKETNRIRRGVGRQLKATITQMPKVGNGDKTTRARLELRYIILTLTYHLTPLSRVITTLGTLKPSNANDKRRRMVSGAKTETVLT
jgi:hypothetical protein